MSNRAKQIRDFIASNHGQCTPGQIAEGIGMAGDKKAYYSIGEMLRKGILTRERGPTSGWLYSIAREVEARGMTPDERRQRRREQEAARRLKAGSRPLAEHKAHVRAQAMTPEERRKRRAEHSASQRRKRGQLTMAEHRERQEANRAERMAQKAAAPKRERQAPVTVAKLVREASVSHASARPLRYDPPKSREVEPESVEAWMARTGRAPEVLPTTWQAPLRYGRYSGADALF